MNKESCSNTSRTYFVFLLLLILQLKVTGLSPGPSAPGFVLIKSTPAGAAVFINGKDTGKKTPYQAQMEEGTYKFTLKYDLYHDLSEDIAVVKGQTVTKELVLKPAYGAIKIVSEPAGATIRLDGVLQNKWTPSTFEKIPSGQHTIALSKDMYSERTEKITVNDERTTEVFMELLAGYGTIGIVAKPAAGIAIDGNKVGSGNYFARLSPGKHKLAFTRENYYPQQMEVTVTQGQEETINVQLRPIVGSVSIMVDPPESAIYLNGKYYGLSPKIIDSLIVGVYSLDIDKPGFATFRQKISIEENKNVEINNTLQSGKLIKVNSNPDSAEVSYKGKVIGYTPVEFVIGNGTNEVTLRKKYYSDKTVTINAVKNDETFTYNLEIDRKKVTIGITTNPDKASIKLDEKPFLSGGYGYSGTPQSYSVISPNFFSVPIGKYDLKVSKKGFAPIEKELFVEKEINYDFTLKPLAYRTKGTAMILSVVWPGAGQAYLKRSGAYSMMGFLGYGALAFSYIQYNQAVDNYDSYLAENTPSVRETLKDKYQKNLNLSHYSLYAGAAVWGANLVWTLITPPEYKKYKNVEFSLLNSGDGMIPGIGWKAEF